MVVRPYKILYAGDAQKSLQSTKLSQNLIYILKYSVHYILYDVSNIKKLSAQWVPRLLTANQNASEWSLLENVLTYSNAIPRSFFDML